MRKLNISSLIQKYKCYNWNRVFWCVNTSIPSQNIQRSVLIQSDIPTKLTIKQKSMNMVNFWGISHVLSANFKIFIKILTNEHYLKKSSLYKKNDVSKMHLDKLYALVLLHYNLLNQHPGNFALISNALVTTAGEITVSCSRKFSSKAN